MENNKETVCHASCCQGETRMPLSEWNESFCNAQFYLDYAGYGGSGYFGDIDDDVYRIILWWFEKTGFDSTKQLYSAVDTRINDVISPLYFLIQGETLASESNGQTNNERFYEVEKEIADIKEQLRTFEAQRKDKQLELSEIKQKLKNTLPRPEFLKLQTKRKMLMEDMNFLEQAGHPYRAKRDKLQAESNALRARIHTNLAVEIKSETDVLEKVKALQTKYLTFAEDQTRINSMRVMAAQLANELNIILSEK